MKTAVAAKTPLNELVERAAAIPAVVNAWSDAPRKSSDTVDKASRVIWALGLMGFLTCLGVRAGILTFMDEYTHEVASYPGPPALPAWLLPAMNAILPITSGGAEISFVLGMAGAWVVLRKVWAWGLVLVGQVTTIPAVMALMFILTQMAWGITRPAMISKSEYDWEMVTALGVAATLLLIVGECAVVAKWFEFAEEYRAIKPVEQPQELEPVLNNIMD